MYGRKRSQVQTTIPFLLSQIVHFLNKILWKKICLNKLSPDVSSVGYLWNWEIVVLCPAAFNNHKIYIRLLCNLFVLDSIHYVFCTFWCFQIKRKRITNFARKIACLFIEFNFVFCFQKTTFGTNHLLLQNIQSRLKLQILKRKNVAKTSFEFLGSIYESIPAFWKPWININFSRKYEILTRQTKLGGNQRKNYWTWKTSIEKTQNGLSEQKNAIFLASQTKNISRWHFFYQKKVSKKELKKRKTKK